MKSLIRKNLATGGNNTLYAFYNTYNFFYKKKTKSFNFYLNLYFIVLVALVILVFGGIYAARWNNKKAK